MDGHLPFEALHNFPDLGGCTTTDGHRVRAGRLYRRSAAAEQDAAGRTAADMTARRPTRREAPAVGGGLTRHPLTQTTCFSLATTSTRSRCWSMTCSIGL
ncbi:tyrosine-protein phosphatase [Streptomyces sp. NPDC001920]